MYEVLTSWVIPSGLPTKSVMYFNTGATVPAIRAAVGNLWTAVGNSINQGVFWSVDPEVRVLNAATGALEGMENDPTVFGGEGLVSGQPVADTTQVNLTWITNVIRNRRFVIGRTYIPGLSRNNLNSGNLLEATRASIATAGQALVDAGVGMSVWHRPQNGGGGVALNCEAATCRSELAVLRKRRNR